MKLVTTKFRSGGLHEKHVVATWSLGETSQHLLIDTGKPRKTCVELIVTYSRLLYVYAFYVVNV